MKTFYLTALFSILFISLFAQPKKVLADKIIATVGDKIILRSEIENSLLDMQRQNIEIPANAKCLLLEQALGLKALVVQAEKDSLPISDEEVEAEIENRIRGAVNQYGSKDAVEQIIGKTLYQFKEDMRPSFREQKLAQSMRNKIVEDIKITPTEVKAYFETIPKDSLPYYESEIEIGQIVIYPKATRELENYAIDQLKEYKKQIESGAKKFETLASLYTDDPGSKETGGKYEINRNEKQWEPFFLGKAFSLKEGQISNVFKTKFGYHIIQMVSRQGDDATIRHILKIPQVTSVEVRETKAKMDSIRTSLIGGSLKFGEAVARFSDDEQSKFTGGRITDRTGSTGLAIDALDKELVVMLKNLTVGEYSQAVEYTDDRGKKGVRIIQLISRTQPHRENLKDDYNKVSQKALEEKKSEILEKWFDKKIPSYYINIDKEFKSCPEMHKWTTNSTASN